MLRKSVFAAIALSCGLAVSAVTAGTVGSITLDPTPYAATDVQTTFDTLNGNALSFVFNDPALPGFTGTNILTVTGNGGSGASYLLTIDFTDSTHTSVAGVLDVYGLVGSIPAHYSSTDLVIFDLPTAQLTAGAGFPSFAAIFQGAGSTQYFTFATDYSRSPDFGAAFSAADTVTYTATSVPTPAAAGGGLALVGLNFLRNVRRKRA